jgi:hypothetical protein
MKRKSILFALLLAFVVTMMVPMAGAAPWYEGVVERWGALLPGSDPEAPITRAEFAHVLNGILEFPASAPTFTDVAGNPYTAAIGALQAANVARGDAGLFRPNDTLTREEAAAFIFRAFAFTEGSALTGPDANLVADWFVGYISALYENGIWEGHANGTIDPKGNLTVAQTFMTIQRAAANLNSVIESGANLLVNGGGTTISNATVGNVIIAPGVGSGEVIFDNVVITGTLFVRGGGTNSIVFRGTSSVGRVIVDRVGGDVRISTEGAATSVGVVQVTGGTGVTVSGNIDTLVVAPTAAAVELVINATVETVQILAPAVTVSVDDAVIGDILVVSTAVGVEIEVVSGTIASLESTAADTVIDNAGGAIASAVVAESVTLTGTAPVELSNDTTSINDVYRG